MKIINKKSSLKLIGLQVAVLISLIAIQMGMQFASSYRWVGWESKTNSWVTIAETAEGENSACQIALTQAQADKQTAIEAANPDLFGGK